jgi:hypothetical protein
MAAFQWQYILSNEFRGVLLFRRGRPTKIPNKFYFLDILFVVGWQNYDNNFQITYFAKNRTMPRFKPKYHQK